MTAEAIAADSDGVSHTKAPVVGAVDRQPVGAMVTGADVVSTTEAQGY